ncbi:MULTISPECIES: helix-turn-helix domain-containing protein [Streptomyces]|uniref:Helix-turn-helix transcriptional regulator n=2 Tax=Streptomyces TaxID=1883 RepID=A0ABU4KDM4_9ACTN|nr:helix-turn-helix transcriptional regulator [Streptomyces roseolus]MDX2295884.1 helix-turn-helix transcriptional regulator [Streptomyces roseolus]
MYVNDTEVNDPEAVELARVLHRLRARAGHPTLAAISRRAGGQISPATLSRLFSGQTLPSRRAVYATAAALTQDSAEWDLVAQAYGRAARARGRSQAYERLARRSEERVQQVGSRPKDPALQELQDHLEHLRSSAGMTIRELAARTGLARSTVSDILRHPRPPKPEAVAALAHALGASTPHELARTAERLRESEAVFDETAVPSPGDPSDAFIRSAITRPPAEIAALAASLRATGETDLAARLIEAAVKELAVEDAATLAVALLNATSTTVQPTDHLDLEPEPAEHHVEVPAQQQEPLPWWKRRRARDLDTD